MRWIRGTLRALGLAPRIAGDLPRNAMDEGGELHPLGRVESDDRMGDGVVREQVIPAEEGEGDASCCARAC